MWIEKKEKKDYLDSSTRGLRLVFSDGVNSNLRLECTLFCKWLRAKYFFPIRIVVRMLSYSEFTTYIGNENEMKEAVFRYQLEFDNKAPEEKRLPKIFIATGKYDKQQKRHGVNKTTRHYLNSIAHELTHYFQWIFYEFDNRTDRSIEMEANSWAGYLVQEYFDDKQEKHIKISDDES